MPARSGGAIAKNNKKQGKKEVVTTPDDDGDDDFVTVVASRRPAAPRAAAVRAKEALKIKPAAVAVVVAKKSKRVTVSVSKKKSTSSSPPATTATATAKKRTLASASGVAAAAASAKKSPAPKKKTKKATTSSAGGGGVGGRKKAKVLINLPTRVDEERFWSQNLLCVAGVDEAGRGPLCGPVVAAAVVCSREFMVPGVHDCKKLSPHQRVEAYNLLLASKDFRATVCIIEEAEIDRINILQASMQAMSHAVRELQKSGAVDHALVDGPRVPADMPVPATPIVKGDAKSYAIAAASVIAKVTRDRIMLEHHNKWPHCGFDTHKGYGTAAHMAAIAKHGPCPIHRMTYAPLNTMKRHPDLPRPVGAPVVIINTVK